MKSSHDDESSIDGTVTEAIETNFSPFMVNEDRLNRVRRYLNKKKTRYQRVHQYKKRSSVANQKLRIKGKFVTKAQAFEILGLNKDNLLNNETVQKLLTLSIDKSVQINTVFTSQDN